MVVKVLTRLTNMAITPPHQVRTYSGSADSVDYSPAPTTDVLNEPTSTPTHHMERPPLTSAASAPNLTLNPRIQQSEEDDLLSSASDEDEALEVKEESTKSAADRRAEKRKMKRFRSVLPKGRQGIMFADPRQINPYAD
ncbi:MAG: hypothetical protein Q9183_001502 [Haloplaca sp. 2 TL-2023]